MLERRRAGRQYRKLRRPVVRAAIEAGRSIRTTIQLQLDALDVAGQRASVSPALARARQQLACLKGGCSPVNAKGRVPQGHCYTHGERPELSGIYSYCSWEGCPADDCVYYGPCVCLCHSEPA